MRLKFESNLTILLIKLFKTKTISMACDEDHEQINS
jgi:hypothetical protein